MRRHPRPLVRLVLGAWLVLAGLVTTAGTGAGDLEYQVKAAFLLNFAKFVDWPEETWSGPAEEFRIGVLGEDPFGPHLPKLLEGKSLQGRPVRLLRFDRWQDFESCQILFIAGSAETLRAGRERLGESATLTVGDTPGFDAAGGMIRFYLADNRVRFAINVDAARQANLALSSKLLNVATITATAPAN